MENTNLELDKEKIQYMRKKILQSEKENLKTNSKSRASMIDEIYKMIIEVVDDTKKY